MVHPSILNRCTNTSCNNNKSRLPAIWWGNSNAQTTTLKENAAFPDQCPSRENCQGRKVNSRKEAAEDRYPFLQRVDQVILHRNKVQRQRLWKNLLENKWEGKTAQPQSQPQAQNQWAGPIPLNALCQGTEAATSNEILKAQTHPAGRRRTSIRVRWRALPTAKTLTKV